MERSPNQSKEELLGSIAVAGGSTLHFGEEHVAAHSKCALRACNADSRAFIQGECP